MENIKKKRSEVNGDGKTSGKKLRTEKEHSNGGVTAEDAEFEEFLAIINRLKAGFRFKNKGVGDCVGKSAMAETGTGDVLENDTVFGFDLNVDPVSD
ncbi:hypothetical protein HanRHA438_Chr17g0838271 [Helianthus annuus]|nr:hypothetical protein HanHA300_Chr17g0674151 [Helianthus annuus]KAJ0449337.1 hypothetical protein HanHA89_Chr17g0727351 [Helianthus annuus]KAJ0828529.1 hypothetical protein HanRHA438_Chr17g0838271 [Helianthus annuus]